MPRPGEGEEQPRVLVQAVPVAGRHLLGVQAPVAGRGLRARAVGPVLGDRLVLVGEPGAVGQELLNLDEIGAPGVTPRRPRPQLPAGPERKGRTRPQWGTRKRCSVPSGIGPDITEPTISAPLGLPSTVTGAPAPERNPSPRMRMAMVPVSSE